MQYVGRITDLTKSSIVLQDSCLEFWKIECHKKDKEIAKLYEQLKENGRYISQLRGELNY